MARVLVVEDEFLIADMTTMMLEDLGHDVIGPVATVEEAINLLGKGSGADCAILDVFLKGQWSYPLAEELARRAMPFGFTTGIDGDTVPQRWREYPRVIKPYSQKDLQELLERLLPRAESA